MMLKRMSGKYVVNHQDDDDDDIVDHKDDHDGQGVDQQYEHHDDIVDLKDDHDDYVVDHQDEHDDEEWRSPPAGERGRYRASSLKSRFKTANCLNQSKLAFVPIIQVYSNQCVYLSKFPYKLTKDRNR